jgi:hypothetical protein
MTHRAARDRTKRAEIIQSRIELAPALRCAARLNMPEGACNRRSVALPHKGVLITRQAE